MDNNSSKKMSDALSVVVAVCLMALVFGTTLYLLIWLFRQL